MVVLGQRFSDALCLANALHAGQQRKVSGVPYISHVLAVASLVIENDGTEDEAIAALLHDAVEDCGGLQTLDAIRVRFGEAVAGIVLGCSDTVETPKPPWRERKEHHLLQLASAEGSVKLVSIADKLHNVRSSLRDLAARGSLFWESFSGGREGVVWYLSELLRIYEQSTVPAPLVAELADSLQRLQALIAITDAVGGSPSSNQKRDTGVPP